VVVLAGDIHVSSQGLRWARRVFPASLPVIYVPGNHEFDGCELDEEGSRLEAEAIALGICFLNCSMVVVGGVRFLGTTLWTDFAIHGDQDSAKRTASNEMPDYHLIRKGDRCLSPDDTQQLHAASRAWLTRMIPRGKSEPTVVVTHHLPHRGSVHPSHVGNPLTPAFASHMPDLVRKPVSLWIHGHTHESMDYTVGGTRVICNPRGYAPDDINPEFDGGFVAEI
jgi:Icc-related predicted phosphoesterase